MCLLLSQSDAICTARRVCVVMPVNECYVDVCASERVHISVSSLQPPANLLHHQRKLYLISLGLSELMGENFISGKLTPGLDWSLILSPSLG